MPSTYYLVLPFAEAPRSTQILMLQRNFFIWKRAGKKIPLGHVPEWAGQWGLAGGKASVDDPATATALRLFYEQTGISLEMDAASYGLCEIRTEDFRDANYRPFTVVFAKLTPEGLLQLSQNINRNINNRDVDTDLFQQADAVINFAAWELLGPVATPENGWSSFVTQCYFGGRTPGMFNTTQDVVRMQLERRSAMQSKWFSMAIDAVSEGSAVPVLAGLEVVGGQVDQIRNRIVRHYDPDGFITIRAVTDPDTAMIYSYIKWKGGFPDPANPNDRRIVPLNVVTPIDRPTIVTAELFGQEQSIEIIVVPEFLGLEVDDAQPVDGDLYRAFYSEPEQFVTVRALVNPPVPEARARIVWEGGYPDPEGRLDRRLVSRQRVTARNHPVEVSATLETRKQVRIEIAPAGIDVIVSNANQTGSGQWVAEYSAGNSDPVLIRAITLPDNELSWTYIDWADAIPISDNVATRRTDQLGETVVVASVPGFQADAFIKIVPKLLGLEAIALAFRDPLGEWYGYQGHEPPILVAAQLRPQNLAAENEIRWTGTHESYKTNDRQTVLRNNRGKTAVIAEIPGAGRLEIEIDVRQPLPINDLRLDVKQIQFANAKRIVDDHNTQMQNVWQRAAKEPLPICYVRREHIQIDPVLSVESPATSDTSLDIRATAFVMLASGACSVIEWNWVVAVAAGSSNDINLGLARSNVGLPDEVTAQDVDPGAQGYRLAIVWEMKARSNEFWTEISTTHHPFYVTLAEPLPNVRPYWTEFKIGCTAASGARDDSEFVEQVYQAFSAIRDDTGTNDYLVATSRTDPANGIKYLTYWGDDTPGQSDQAMLANPNGYGSCLAFAMMLVNIYRLNGIHSGRVVEAEPNGGLSSQAAEANGFLVRNWKFDVLPAENINWTLQENVLSNRWQSGAGQNQQFPPPVFQNHFIVWDDLTAKFYDPSYGSNPQHTEMDWENGATDGLSRSRSPNLGFIKQAPGTPKRILKLT